MIAAVDRLRESPYEDELVFEMYQRYVEGADLKEEILAGILPLLNMTAYRQFASLSEEEREDLISGSYIYLFEHLDDLGLPMNDPFSFRKFLMTCIKRYMLDHINEVTSQEVDIFFGQMPIYCELEGAADVDRRLLYEQVIKVSREEAIQRIRFKNGERAACNYIINCIYENDHISTNNLTKVFGIPKARLKFFLDYAFLLVRSSIWRVRGRD